MYQTKGAIGNLINRYRAVLKKCHLLNTFGSLAVAGMLVMGGVAPAMGYADGVPADGNQAGLAEENQRSVVSKFFELHFPICGLRDESQHSF